MVRSHDRSSSLSSVSSNEDVVDNYDQDKDYYRPDIPDELHQTCCQRFADWACGGCKCLGCRKPISWMMLLGAFCILGAYAVLSAWFISAFVSINWGAAMYRTKTLKESGANQDNNAMWWVVKGNGDFVMSGTSQFKYESSDTAGSSLYLTETCSYNTQCSDVFSSSSCDSAGICVADQLSYEYGKDMTDAGLVSLAKRLSNATTALTSRENSDTLGLEIDVRANENSGLLPIQHVPVGGGDSAISSDVNQITATGQHFKMASIGKSLHHHTALPHVLTVNSFRPQQDHALLFKTPTFEKLESELQLSSLIQAGRARAADQAKASKQSLALDSRRVSIDSRNANKAVSRQQLDATLTAHHSISRIKDGLYRSGIKFYMSVAMLFGKAGAEANATSMSNLCEGKEGGIGLHEEESKVFVYIPDGLSNYGPNAYCAESDSIEIVSWDDDDLLSGYVIMDFTSHADSVWTGGSDTSFQDCLEQVSKDATYPYGQMYWQMQFYCAEPLPWYMVTNVVLNDLINIFLAVALLWYEIIEFCVGKRKVWYERFAIQCFRVCVYFIVGGQLLGDLNQYWVTIGFWALAFFTVIYIFMHVFFCFAWLKIEEDDQPMFGLISHWFDATDQQGAKVERDSDGKFILVVSDDKKKQMKQARRDRGEDSSSSSSSGNSSASSLSDDSPRGAGSSMEVPSRS